MESLLASVTREAGKLAAAIRLAAVEGRGLPPELAEFAAKVRAKSALMTTGDVEALRLAGLNCDAVFELVVCAASGAGRDILNAGMTALRSSKDISGS